MGGPPVPSLQTQAFLGGGGCPSRWVGARVHANEDMYTRHVGSLEPRPHPQGAYTHTHMRVVECVTPPLCKLRRGACSPHVCETERLSSSRSSECQLFPEASRLTGAP